MRHIDSERLFELAKAWTADADCGEDVETLAHLERCRSCRETLSALVDELDELEDTMRSDGVLA